MKLSGLFSKVNEQGFQKYFRNTFWLFAEKLSRVVVSLFVGVWVARYLGPTQYGVFNYAISYLGIFIVLSTLRLDAIIVREQLKAKIIQFTEGNHANRMVAFCQSFVSD